jgi:hypothetical protein
MKMKVVTNQPNNQLRLTIPQMGKYDSVIDPSCNYSVIPEKVFLKHNLNMVPWYKVLRTSFGTQKVRMIMLAGVKVLDKHIETLEVAVVPGASKVIVGRNLIESLHAAGLDLEYRFINSKLPNEI